MGVAERKERQKAELREQILAAAREIVARDGFAALTMRKIADAIEYSPGTLYLYFANRDELAKELVREGAAQLMTFFEDARHEPDPLLRLEALGRRYIDFAVADPQTYRMVFLEDPRLSAAIVEPATAHGDPDDPGRSAFELLVTTVAELVATGVFKPVDPAMGAHLFWAALHGLAALQMTCPAMMIPAGLRTAAAQMTTTLIAGMRSEAA